MFVVYIVTVFLVTALLLFFPLYPFCKVANIVRARHADIWNAQGPFTLSEFVSSSAALSGFFDFIAAGAKDETLKQKDPELARWCNVAQSVDNLRPRSFPAQVGYFLIFLYFTGTLTSLILSFLRS
jgi:hypothetical protein